MVASVVPCSECSDPVDVAMRQTFVFKVVPQEKVTSCQARGCGTHEHQPPESVDELLEQVGASSETPLISGAYYSKLGRRTEICSR